MPGLGTYTFEPVQAREGLQPGQVTLHSDNGGLMKGATLKATLGASAF